MATDYNALAAQAGAISSNPPPVSSAPTPPPPNGGSVDYSALAAQHGAINSTPAPAAPAPPGVAERAIAGANRSSLSTFSNPQTATEHVVDAITGGTGAGLAAWRTAKSLVDSVKNAMDAKKPEEFSQAKSDVQRAVQDFHNRDYRNLAADAGSVAGDAIPVPVVGNAVRNISEGTRPGGDLAGALGQAAGDTAVLAGTAAAGAGAGAEAPEAAAETTAAPQAATHIYDPVTRSIKQLTQGEKVAQAPAQSVLRSTAQASAEDAGVPSSTAPSQGIRTLMDEPIDALAKTERATYDAVNKASGTDMKSLYDHAEEVQDALDDPTNIANRKSLTEDLQTTQDAIKDGETKATAAGVDPQAIKDAQAMTQKRYAIQNVKQKLFNNESVVQGNAAHGAPESINVESAIKQVENLNKPSRFAPEGTPTRLQQALGEKGAKDLLQGLYDAQKAGKTALSRQQTLVKFGKILGLGGGIVAAGEAALHAIGGK
jgi:hypothetical protein